MFADTAAPTFCCHQGCLSILLFRGLGTLLAKLPTLQMWSFNLPLFCFASHKPLLPCRCCVWKRGTLCYYFLIWSPPNALLVLITAQPLFSKSCLSSDAGGPFSPWFAYDIHQFCRYHCGSTNTHTHTQIISVPVTKISNTFKEVQPWLLNDQDLEADINLGLFWLVSVKTWMTPRLRLLETVAGCVFFFF